MRLTNDNTQEPIKVKPCRCVLVAKVINAPDVKNERYFMQKLVECVPNFSNGRSPHIYQTIAEAIASVPRIRVLGISPDVDHNRTVVTFVGEPADVIEAAFRGIQKAAELINLDEHSGEHPRLGATDVCPLIPIQNMTMKECVGLAHELGQRVGNELGIPVYLYAHAATRPDRVRLPDIRQGEYEAWKTQIGQETSRIPDYGPTVAKPCGATTIGARPFLIAYNLFLNTPDVNIAKKIARAIRESSGGLKNIQAKGFWVHGQAQVSMNLMDFYQTPIHRVQEMVKREAAHWGTAVTHAELIGLIPQQALLDAAKWYLQLKKLKPEQILEQKIQATADPLVDSVSAFVQATAEDTPAPGGGAVAALAGSLAAALTQMVAGLTLGRKKYADVAEQAQEIRTQAEQLRQQLLTAIPADGQAFEEVLATQRNKSIPKAARQQKVQEALENAINIPLHIAGLALEVAQLAKHVAQVGNLYALTDASASGIMARAAVQTAVLNVRINAKSLINPDQADGYLRQAIALESEATLLAEEICHIAAERGGF